MGKRILGLDLGTNSIGWAVVDDLANGKFELIKRGVHVFPEAVNDATQGGARKSKAAGRREKRSARKLNYRRKIRKINTLDVLVEHGMCPGITTENLDVWRYGRKTEKCKCYKEYPKNEEFRRWQNTNDLSERNGDAVKRNPYLYRFEAIDRKFDLDDEKERLRLGRVFYHLAQRRGFKSNSLNGGSADAYDAFHESLQKELGRKHDSVADIVDIINELTEGEQDKKVKKLRNGLLRIFKKQLDLEDAVTQALALMEKPEFMGKVKKGIHDLDIKIEESNSRTLGEYYYQCYEYQNYGMEFDDICRVPEIDDKRKRELYGDKIRGHYTDREKHYEAEFNEICRMQCIGKDSELYKKLHNAIFYQRPLRSQKGLVANCSLEFRLPVFTDGEPEYRDGKLVTYSKKCASVSHPIFEEFRMWSFINQIKWKKAGEKEMQFLSGDQKKQIEYLFYRKSKPYFKFSEITGVLFGKGALVERDRNEEKIKAHYYVNYALDTSVSACPVVSRFRECFGKDFRKLLSGSYKGAWKNTKGNKKSDDDILTEVWGVLFSREDSEERKRQLLKKWAVPVETADAFSTIKLPSGYASLSLAAMRKIVPVLKRGMIYSHAVLFANLPAVLRGSNIDDVKVKELLSKKLDSYSSHRRKVAVANKLIAESKSPDSIMDEVKRVADFEKKVRDSFVEKYGSSCWDKMSDNEAYEFCLQIIDLIRVQYANQNDMGNWIKLVPLKKMLKDILVDEFGVSKERAMLLYHPSDISQHNPYRKSETGLLESPIVSSIKNPVFMRTMHRLKAVVNALLQSGVINSETEIHVEMAREMNTANMRAVIESENKKRKERRDKYAEIIKKLMDKDASETDLLKFKLWEELTPQDSEQEWLELNAKIEEKSLKYELWEEQRRICPYTGKTIGLADFLSDNPRFEIEHILPRSRSFDNSEENLTLCCKEYNREQKKNRIPSECQNYDEIRLRIGHWKSRADELEVEIKKTVSAARNADPERKAKIIQKRHRLKLEKDHYAKKYERFLMKEVPDSFANRQLNDTRIITKYACFYLKSVFGNVMTVNGLTVAELRKQWGLQHSEKKSREKHTHHCIDAVVIACMTKRQYDQLKAFYEREEDEKFNHGNPAELVPQPWDDFIPSIKQLESEVLVSHYAPNNLLKRSGMLPPKIRKKVKKGTIKNDLKKKKTARARLHKDTFYGRVLHKGEEISVVRVPLVSSNEALKGFKNLDDLKARIVDRGVSKRVGIVARLLMKKSKLSFSEALKANVYMKNTAVDEIIKKRVREGKELLDALSEPIFINGKMIMPIRRVRCQAATVKVPLRVKKQRDKSKKYNHPHKQFLYAENASVSAVAVYELNGSVLHEGYDALTATKKHLAIPDVKKDKNGREYGRKWIFYPKQKVFFYDAELDELKTLKATDLSIRLFYFNDLSKKENERRAGFRHHLVAGKKEDLIAENKRNKGINLPSEMDFEFPNPLQRISFSNLKIALEGTDFRLNVLGEIEWLNKGEEC